MLLVQTRVVDVQKKQLVLDEILKDLDRIANDSLPQVILELYCYTVLYFTLLFFTLLYLYCTLLNFQF